ncbi:MAG: class I SAM-dependent methyltransferase [Alphaproteobacteria bacterium]|nr:class I SAM-dependent methyltransferase [Alphaproteobacteria bacterium]
MTVEQRIAAHYAHGSLAQAIRAALIEAGRNPERLRAEDLAPADEFHIGARQATVAFTARLGLTADMHVLDVGCGIGGAARHMAQAHGCRVTGIDLSADYVAVAIWLSEAIGIGDRVSFRQGSVNDLPFAPATFDGATMLHVGMNVPDKPWAFACVRRVLKPGGFFAIYDVMRFAGGDIAYPMPWAATPDTSFLASEAEYRAAAEAAGFRVVETRDRSAFAIEFIRTRIERMKLAAPSPVGLHILMGKDYPQKIANMLGAIQRGQIAPVEMICRA